jgi:hypothetical protein
MSSALPTNLSTVFSEKSYEPTSDYDSEALRQISLSDYGLSDYDDVKRDHKEAHHFPAPHSLSRSLPRSLSRAHKVEESEVTSSPDEHSNLSGPFLLGARATSAGTATRKTRISMQADESDDGVSVTARRRLFADDSRTGKGATDHHAATQRMSTAHEDDNQSSIMQIGATAQEELPSWRQEKMQDADVEVARLATCNQAPATISGIDNSDTRQVRDGEGAKRKRNEWGLQIQTSFKVDYSSEIDTKSPVSTSKENGATIVIINEVHTANHVNEVDTSQTSPAHTTEAIQAPCTNRAHASSPRQYVHGHRALKCLGFVPLQKTLAFTSSTRPKTPRERPHSRVWLDSYFSKASPPLWFPQFCGTKVYPKYFDVKTLSEHVLVEGGIHLETEGERQMSILSKNPGQRGHSHLACQHFFCLRI